MRIALLGMPASGKSTLGRLLAQRSNYAFVDLDELIERREKRSIPRIFKEEGEDYFRGVEQKALEQALKLDRSIIATGGGTPCFFDNLLQIKAQCLSIWVDTPLKEILRRLRKRQNRPLFKANADDLENKIRDTYQRRRSFYQQAHLRLKVEDYSIYSKPK